jgi:ABC-type transport system involved in multi-copper enzyme maturation permease subunit
VIVAALGAMGTLATRIDQALGGTPGSADLVPTRNVLGAKFEDWILFAAIFSSIGLLTQERVAGTLAWTLSKPVSRASVLFGKWAAGVVMLSIFAVALPLTASVLVATWSYGALPDIPIIARFGLVLLAIPAFFVALNLAVATRLNSQAAIAAIAFGVYAAPYLIGGFAPQLAELWPTSMAAMAGAFAGSDALSMGTVASWALSVVALGALAVLALNREDL